MKRILAASLLVLCPYVAVAQTAPIQVLASNGVKAALEALKPGIERAAGHPLNIVYGASAGLKRQITAGEAFDLAILTPETTADLTKAGKDRGGNGGGFGTHGGRVRHSRGRGETGCVDVRRGKADAAEGEVDLNREGRRQPGDHRQNV